MTTVKIASLDSTGNVPSALLAKQGRMSSGFPTRRTSELEKENYFELSNASTYQASPVGSKPLVLCEVWDKPSVLRHIWIAGANAGENSSIKTFVEQGGVIRIYNDNDTSPRVNLPLADFFAYGPMCDKFSNKRIGRTANGGNQQTGAYRYLWSPSQKYLRVEIENVTSQIPEFTTTLVGGSLPTLTANGNVTLSVSSLSGVGSNGGGGTLISAADSSQHQFRFNGASSGTPNTLTGVGLVNGSSNYTPAAGDTIKIGNNATGFYAAAGYSLPGSFSDLGPAQLSYYISSVGSTTWPTPVSGSTAAKATLLNLSNVGPGQIESLMMRISGASANDSAALEGNIIITPDGASTPSLRSSGTEDFFNGAWYNMPVGGYPAGIAGSSGAGTGFAVSAYRFFEDDPQFFNTGVRVDEWVGQIGEAGSPYPGSTTVDFNGRVGYWLDTPQGGERIRIIWQGSRVHGADSSPAARLRLRQGDAVYRGRRGRA